MIADIINNYSTARWIADDSQLFFNFPTIFQTEILSKEFIQLCYSIAT